MKIPTTLNLPAVPKDFKAQLVLTFLSDLCVALKKAYFDIATAINYNRDHRNDV